MKFFFIFFSVLFLTISCAKVNIDFKSYLTKNMFDTPKSGTIIAKVNGKPVSLKEVRDEMKYSLGVEFNEKAVESLMADSNLQKIYENKIINQYLLINHFIESKVFNSKDFNDYIFISLKEAIVKYYLYQKFFEKKENQQWKDLIITSDAEVTAFYIENKKFFIDKGVKETDALSAIREDLQKNKNAAFMAELTRFQDNLINEIKIKYKVERLSN